MNVYASAELEALPFVYVGIDGLGLLRAILSSPKATCSVVAASVQWQRLLRNSSTIPPIFASVSGGMDSALGNTKIASKGTHVSDGHHKASSAEETRQSIMFIVRDVVQGLLDSEVDYDTPLMEAGLDSLGKNNTNVRLWGMGKATGTKHCLQTD